MEGMLGRVKGPEDIKKLTVPELDKLAGEIRSFLVDKVSQNGGHLAANLGVVELTLALHTVFDSPRDKIIWDVGHQSYVHKLITGRREGFETLRRYGGMSGFPKKAESPHDVFETGHSSTSVSAALGLARARDLAGGRHHVLAVIGDGSIGGGMAFEALNHAGDMGTDLLVVLNDNEMSISQNVGGLAAYLGRLRTDPKYFRVKEDIEDILKKIPAIGGKVLKSVERVKDALKFLLVPGMIFEELGFTYLGPVNGHHLESLLGVLRGAKKLKGPVLIHVLTKKGKGYEFAESNPDIFHGIGPFDPKQPLQDKSGVPTFTEVFSETLMEAAEKDPSLLAITAAMAGGTGLDAFAARFPERFFDVGIAEQHAVTFAAGLATAGFRPVVAVYSTFLQRAYDQVLHDVCMQNLPVMFALDRAGIVGEDGETHQGVFDLAYLRHIPNMSVLVPRDENMLKHTVATALSHDGPVAVRYPRGRGYGTALTETQILPWGKGEILRQGRDIAVFAVGTMVQPALEAADKLLRRGLSVAVIDPVFVKPLDRELLLEAARSARFGAVTVEEHMLAGGFGSAIMEMLEEEKAGQIKVIRLGVPDRFVAHGARQLLLKELGLLSENIIDACLNLAGEKEKRLPWAQGASDWT